MTINKLIIVYLALLNIITIIITIVDKHNAKRGKSRISEDFLMTIGLLGGAFSEYIIMKIIAIKPNTKNL